MPMFQCTRCTKRTLPRHSGKFCSTTSLACCFKDSSSTAEDFGANLLGAMVGGVGEYLSLLAGYQFLLILVAGCYLLALGTAGWKNGKTAGA